jgi:hypothetical protein
MAEAVVGGALLRIGENAVSFSGLAEFYFGSVFLLGVAVRVPFERGFTVADLISSEVAVRMTPRTS